MSISLLFWTSTLAWQYHYSHCFSSSNRGRLLHCIPVSAVALHWKAHRESTAPKLSRLRSGSSVLVTVERSPKTTNNKLISTIVLTIDEDQKPWLTPGNLVKQGVVLVFTAG